MMMVTIVERIRTGTNSMFNAHASGSMPPMARPSRNRNASSAWYEPARAVAVVSSPKLNAATTTVGRRPMRSARNEKKNPPSIMPKRPAEKTRPSIIFDKPNSSRMNGAVKLTIIMSKPSNTVISQDSAISP